MNQHCFLASGSPLQSHPLPTSLPDGLPLRGGVWGGAQLRPQAGGVEGAKPSTDDVLRTRRL